jgi:hypothetical protein
MNSGNADESRCEWWELFYVPFNVKINNQYCTIPFSTTAAHTLPIIIYLCCTFMLSFFILSNQNYLDRSLENARSHSKNIDQDELFELNKEANRQILQNPGMRVIISITITYKCFISFVCTIIVFWIGVAFLCGQWDNFPDYWLITSSTLSVLCMSSIVLFVFQTSLLLFDENIGLLLFIRDLDRSSILFKFLSQMDLFNIWFLYLLSARLSAYYQESRRAIFILLVFIFVLIILLFSLGGMDFILIY